jgi:hypothetical protein
MKIAICVFDNDISDKATENYLLQYEKILSGHSVDYFLHRWNSDLDALSHPMPLNWFSVVEMTSRKEKIVEKLSSILPKKFLIKSLTFYGLMRATNLKINHEIENKMCYDLCIGIYGKIYPLDYTVMCKELKIPKINTVYTFNCKPSNLFPYFSINYKFFYSDTLTFNKISEFFRFLPNLITYLRNIPEDCDDMPLAFYIKNLNVINENTLAIMGRLS